jgi:hypothetical protein
MPIGGLAEVTTTEGAALEEAEDEAVDDRPNWF